jgi:hypothetical protein
MAKIKGGMAKAAPPAAFMISPISISQGASPSAPPIELPTPSRIPATGTIRASPIFCGTANLLLPNVSTQMGELSVRSRVVRFSREGPSAIVAPSRS